MTILAVDGGQSSVAVRWGPERESAGDRVREIVLPGVTRIGDHTTAIVETVRVAHARLDCPPIDTVVLGLTTAPRQEPELDRLAAEVAGLTGARRVWVADDTVTTHAAALRGQPGVCLWVGTGVACLALGPQGLRTFDGFGFLLGDRGGAFDIGRTALAAILRRRQIYDAPAHLDSSASLVAAAEARFGPLDAVPLVIHDSPTPVADLAAFAVDVMALAQGSGDGRADRDALSIIESAADELVRTIAAATRWAGKPTPVALGGGAVGPADRPSVLGSAVMERVRRAIPATPVTIADSTALDGAEWLAGRADPGPYRSHVHIWLRSPQP